MSVLDDFLKKYVFRKGFFDDEKIRVGDFNYAMKKTDEFSKLLSTAVDEFLVEENFENLSPEDKGMFLRNVLQPKIDLCREYVSGFAGKSLTNYFKKNGFVFSSDYNGSDKERLKGIIANSMNFFVKTDVEDSFQKGLNQLTSGAEQYVSAGARDSFISSSEIFKGKTGVYLRAKRVIGSSNPCNFCLEHAEKEFFVKPSDYRLRWHDHCKCSLVILED